MGLNLRDLQLEVPNKIFPAVFVKYALCQILPALLVLHNQEVNVTYIYLHSGNIMLSFSDDEKETEAAFAGFADAEIKDSTPRKQDQSDGRIIYESRVSVRSKGPLYLKDFGEARIGSVHRGMAMPTPYRAPELLLAMSWNDSVDMWIVGLTVRYIEKTTSPVDNNSNGRNDLCADLYAGLPIADRNLSVPELRRKHRDEHRAPFGVYDRLDGSSVFGVLAKE